jgi:hypothetical protein
VLVCGPLVLSCSLILLSLVYHFHTKFAILVFLLQPLCSLAAFNLVFGSLVAIPSPPSAEFLYTYHIT